MNGFYDDSILYLEPPNGEISIEAFSNLCLARVKMLRTVEQYSENLKLRDDIDLMELKIDEKIDTLSNKTFEDKTSDMISHHITKLAFCSDDAKHKWFATQEARLFKSRISKYSIEEKKNFAKKLKIEFTLLTASEWDKDFQTKLFYSTFRKSLKKLHNENKLSYKHFYKVDFKNAAFFVSNLKCFLHKGVAYLFIEDITNLLVNAFKDKILKSLALSKKNYTAVIEEDPRLAPLLKNVSDAYLGKDYSNFQTSSKRGKINLADIEGLSKRSFPPCMRYLYDNMKSTHHLKHDGRMQLGLFMKGIGLSLEDSVTLWKTEFTKKITADEFEKGYAYNIRHNYGKEGKRVDYNPHACDKIIRNHAPSNGEFHGCPFRHLSEGNLIIFLRKMGIDTMSPQFQDVLERVKGKHFQIACKYIYQMLHPRKGQGNLDEFDGQHPNNYFESSLSYSNSNQPQPQKENPHNKRTNI